VGGIIYTPGLPLATKQVHSVAQTFQYRFQLLIN
jgi:hypothetical protein